VESDPISLKITVLKKLQEQWWFSLFIILLLGALLVFGVRYYYKQEIREVLLRNQISADLHDDIGASMSNIGILITLIRQRLGGNGETTALLDRVDEEVASSADALDDIIWSINPINDPLDRVLARMRRFATEVFEAKDINGVIQFPQNIQHLRLGLEKRRQFYLLFKEAVNNLAKYAQCTEASIVVEYHKGVLFLTITDNGVGFNVEESKEKGNGLKTMLDRAVKLNAAFTIESTPGHGTFIQVLLPITE
jgi:signal transduction histidine kinase